jgi:APA family basic amino acid/polyamine antiporter
MHRSRSLSPAAVGHHSPLVFRESLPARRSSFSPSPASTSSRRPPKRRGAAANVAHRHPGVAIVTVLYVLVSVVLTGLVPYAELNTAAPLATALAAVGQTWAVGIVSAGAIAGLTSVILVMLLGESRIAFAMSRDHVLPGWLGRVDSRFKTPYRITLVTGGVVAVAAALTPIDQVAELVNIGSLLAFTFVSLAVVVLKRSRPTLRRAFRTPFVPWVPGLSALGCLYLMVNLPVLS